MFSHFTLGSNDLRRANAFFSPVMEALGQSLVTTSPTGDYLMFAPPEQRYPHLFICQPFDDLPATWSNGYHIAFNAPDQEAVDRFHATALANGGFDEGVPGLRPEPGSAAESLALWSAQANGTEAVSYGTEAGLFQQIGIPAVICGPGSIDQAHKPDEFVAIEQLNSCDDYLRRVAQRCSESTN